MAFNLKITKFISFSAERLIEKGLAYKCFCTEKRLDLMRREAVRYFVTSFISSMSRSYKNIFKAIVIKLRYYQIIYIFWQETWSTDSRYFLHHKSNFQILPIHTLFGICSVSCSVSKIRKKYLNLFLVVWILFPGLLYKRIETNISHTK